MTNEFTLIDPLLGVLADAVDDLEMVRIANENRVRSLTDDSPGTDTWIGGHGLTLENKQVAKLAAIVDVLRDTEHQAILNLEKSMRQHPLGPWCKGTKGVGEKQLARLLAEVGDPYWNGLHDRPRLVSELWAFCGFHVLRTGSQTFLDTQSATAAGADPTTSGDGHRCRDTHGPPAVAGTNLHSESHRPADAHMTCALGVAQTSGGSQTAVDSQESDAAAGLNPHPEGHAPSDIQASPALGVAQSSGGSQPPGDTHDGPAAAGTNDHPEVQPPVDAHGRADLGVAPARRRGQKVNWSQEARKRTWLIAASCIKFEQSPYRKVYDAGRTRYADAVHQVPCVRCGPSGKPAQVGSPLSAGHQHARAMRLMGKEILRDLWTESKRLHEAAS